LDQNGFSLQNLPFNAHYCSIVCIRHLLL
jgi:hypothetical protein